MALFAQHGHGKSTKIDEAFSNNLLSGVILRPKDELPANMINYINTLRRQYPDKEVLFDPQFYLTPRTSVNDGQLPSYDFYRPNLTRRNFFSTSDIETYVSDVMDYQIYSNVTKLISPTVYVEDFNNQWSQIALTLAHQSQNYCQSIDGIPPLLISICVNEHALRNLDALNEFLDMISLLDVQGFYIIISRNTNNCNPQFEPELLERLMYFSYILSTINNYEVVFGYTDFVGIPLHAVGISSTASGWFNKLKQFSISNFDPSSGGRQPRPRYSSKQLLNSILIIPELETIADVIDLNVILSNNSYDRAFYTNPGNAPWPQVTRCLHHWHVLNEVITNIEIYPNVSKKLDYVMELIAEAQSIYNTLEREGVPFENNSNSNHLVQWNIAIDNFRNSMGV